MGCCYSDASAKGHENKNRMLMGGDYTSMDVEDIDADGLTDLSLGAIVIPPEEVAIAECLRIEVIEGPDSNLGYGMEINA